MIESTSIKQRNESSSLNNSIAITTKPLPHRIPNSPHKNHLLLGIPNRIRHCLHRSLDSLLLRRRRRIRLVEVDRDREIDDGEIKRGSGVKDRATLSIGYFNSTSRRKEERMDVMTSDADDVKDFTTEDRYFRMPTVISPISTVLLLTTTTLAHFATVSRA